MLRLSMVIFCLGMLMWNSAQASSGIIENAKNPDSDDSCLYPDTNIVIEKGKTVVIAGECEKATCSEYYDIHLDGCGPAVDVDSDGCIGTPVDLRHSWPLCCPNVYCEDDGYTFFKEEMANSKYPTPNKD